MRDRKEFGAYLQQLRLERGMPLRVVSEGLGIDLTMLSRIERGERQIQSSTLRLLSELFEIDYKSLQIQFLQQKLHEEFGTQPYFEDSLKNYLENIRNANPITQ